MTQLDPCSKVRAQVAQDKRRGKTTSEAAKDFIRRTCVCSSCQDWRRAHSRVRGVL